MDPELPAIPEISPEELSQRLKDPASLVLLDVREPYELTLARLPDDRLTLVPISELAHAGLSALPEPLRANPAAEVVVLCHVGIRSAQVTGWLLAQGWQNVRSLAGGIDAYARQVDRRVGMY